MVDAALVAQALYEILQSLTEFSISGTTTTVKKRRARRQRRAKGKLDGVLRGVRR